MKQPREALESLDIEIFKEKVKKIVEKKGVIHFFAGEDQPIFTFKGKSEVIEFYSLYDFVMLIIPILATGTIERNLFKAAVVSQKRAINRNALQINEYLKEFEVKIWVGYDKEGVVALIKEGGEITPKKLRNEQIIDKILSLM